MTDAPTTLTVAATDVERAPGPRSKRIRYGWVLETVGFVAVYQLYDWLRTQATGTFETALRNAKDIVSAEKFLGIYWEHGIQHPFLHADWFMAFWNIYYGTIHFVMPVARARVDVPARTGALRPVAQHADHHVRAGVPDVRASTR